MSNKLLLADDSITIRKVVGIIFANEDYSLTVVDNGNAALEKIREIVPDIVLADVVMPGKNGYEVCEEIRQEPDLKHIPLLLMTGAFEPFDEEKAGKCGADDFISKPFESQQLLDKVRTLVELGKSRKAAPAAPEPEIEVPQPVPFEPPIEAFAGGAVAQAEAGIGETVFLGEELTSSEEVVEALPEDDLWGAFELEEVTLEPPVEPEPVLGEEIVDPFAELTAMDLQSLGAEKTPLETPVSPVEEIAPPSWAPPGEEIFTLGEEPETLVFESEQEEELFTMASEEELATEEVFVLGADTEVQPSEADLTVMTAESAPAAPEMELQFAPEEEYVPVLPVASAPLMAPLSAAAETAQPAAGGELTLSEEQLAAIIGKISRDVIERIAWEVVPDLSEMLIREEIRKIRSGIQD